MLNENLIKLFLELISNSNATSIDKPKKENEVDLAAPYIGKYVLLSTNEKLQGVFFGKLLSLDMEKMIAVLDESQMAVKWSVETRGFNNLAVTGPAKGSRITNPCGQQTLTGVCSIALATDKAINEWKMCKWD